MSSEATPVDGIRVLDSLSPSRAGDFLACPLRYRFRTVDRLPERPSPAAARGSVVHRVLELLFDLPAEERTPARAAEMLRPAWEELLEAEPVLAELFADAAAGVDGADRGQEDRGADEAPELDSWLAGCATVLERWFGLEDPQRLEPAERETYVETVLDSGLLLRGYVDRLDVAPDGRMRIVDYKTGRAPDERFEAAALFQLRFYALVLWRSRGVVPSMLQLVYLGNGEILRYQPDEDDLRATERKIEAVWQAIRTAAEEEDWRPRPGPLCAWCSFQELCPAYGGTPPPVPSAHVPEGPTDEADQAGVDSTTASPRGLITPEAISSA